MSQLEQYRLEIDDITREMMDLLEKRLQLSEQVADYKQIHGMKVLQPEREAALLARYAVGTYQKEKKVFLEMLFDLSRQLQEEKIKK